MLLQIFGLRQSLHHFNPLSFIRDRGHTSIGTVLATHCSSGILGRQVKPNAGRIKRRPELRYWFGEIISQNDGRHTTGENKDSEDTE